MVISITVVLLAVIIAILSKGLVSISLPFMKPSFDDSEMRTAIQLIPTPSMAMDSSRLHSKPQFADFIRMKPDKVHGEIDILDEILIYCNKLGYILKLKASSVRNIWDKHLDPSEKCEEAIWMWLDGLGSTPFTWETFIEALETLELWELSNKLRHKLE